MSCEEDYVTSLIRSARAGNSAACDALRAVIFDAGRDCPAAGVVKLYQRFTEPDLKHLLKGLPDVPALFAGESQVRREEAINLSRDILQKFSYSLDMKIIIDLVERVMLMAREFDERVIASN